MNDDDDYDDDDDDDGEERWSTDGGVRFTLSGPLALFPFMSPGLSFHSISFV